MKEISVALIGNPNSGKTTIFNNLTGSRQHVGNYPGVTVEKKSGIRAYKDYKINFIDLPGIYNLTAFSLDEVVSRNYIIYEKPDIVLNVVDASNIERNLYLSTQLIELGIPIVFAFNMADVAKKRGKEINTTLLSELFNAPIVETVGSRASGMDMLLEEIVVFYEQNKKDISEKKKVEINFGNEIENEISKIVLSLKRTGSSFFDFPGYRWTAIKLLEHDSEVLKDLEKNLDYEAYSSLKKQADNSVSHVSRIMNSSIEILMANARYGFIRGALRETLKELPDNLNNTDDKIDRILTHRIFGLPIFALIMWIMFQVVFKIGDYPMRWLEAGFIKLAELINVLMPDNLIRSLLVDGIIGGVGGILVFTPKIMLLFIFIALFEDSGYMARAAFVMDRIMHKIGLHGKSFIPMLIGFGCTIPGYMSSRIIESKNDRLVTMHVNTFMSCGGRLPIYILFAGSFFPQRAGTVIFLIYFIGIIFAILSAKFLRITRFKGEAEPFVMELPSYRIPTFKSISIHMWERTWMYLKKAGTVILAVSIIMWILFTFPRIGENYSQNYDSQISEIQQAFESKVISQQDYELKINDISGKMNSEKIEYSAAGRIGHFVAPIFRPLGFDWRMAVASISGMAGKEITVSTIGTLFSLGESQQESLSIRLAREYSPLQGFNFMLFSLLYFPCLASLAVFQREAGFKEMFFQIIYTLLIAWITAFAVFQIGSLFI